MAPDRLGASAPGEWFGRYGARCEDARLPKGDAARNALAATVGADGFVLLDAVRAPSAPAWLRELPAVEVLRRAWVHRFRAATARCAGDRSAAWRPRVSGPTRRTS